MLTTLREGAMGIITNTNYRQSVFLSAGTVFNAFLGLIFYILIARVLSVSDFGQVSFILGLGLLFAEVGDLGFGNAVVKFGHGEDFAKIFSLTLLQRFLVSAVLLLIALGLFIVSGPGYLSAFAVAISFFFLSLVTQSFIAKEKYWLFIGTNVFGNTSRLVLTGGIYFLNQMSVISAVGAFTGANVLSFIFGLMIIKLTTPKLFDFAGAKKKAGEVIRFSGWLGGSMAINSAATKIDVPLLYALSGSLAVGLYSSAQRLTNIFLQISGALDGVFSPKLAKSKDREILRDYFILAGLICLGILILFPVSGLVITLIFGEKYAGSVPIFQIFLIGFLFFFLAGPLSASVVYRHGRSNYHFIGAVLQLWIGIVFYLLLIPRFGAAGAAMAFVVQNLFSFLYFGLCLRLLRTRS